MKLADAPAGLREALDQKRYTPRRSPRHPDDGELWFDATDDSFRCAVCGSTRGPIVVDHCHVTGLVRGDLCVGCNTKEGNGIGDVWPYWRALAPELATRELYLSNAHSQHLSGVEVLSDMTVADLFRLDVRRQMDHDGSALCGPVYDTAIGLVVSPVGEWLTERTAS